MIPTFRIDPEFHGPTLCELRPILADLQLGDPPLEVRWGGYPMDYVWLEKARLHPLVLVVPDQEVLEKTLWRLGGALAISPEEVSTAMKTLFVKADQSGWRQRVTELGATRGTQLLVRIVSDTLKAGTRARPSSVAIARECLLEHTHPADADVLLRLRGRRR